MKFIQSLWIGLRTGVLVGVILGCSLGIICSYQANRSDYLQNTIIIAKAITAFFSSLGLLAGFCIYFESKKIPPPENTQADYNGA
jgi:ABC-type uncharacterized transport system permease subunit